ncbi:MAG: UDP-N-acetylmuramoyl-tripeptide--D-alanyl-D-alanine ligase [Burkholderiales bacterium]|nr:UDP-N-acetylmuramoyl-tripeptide--D-alanyl-D-alanine ligase [Bacteroidia bacterium]
MNKFISTEALYELFISCKQKITTDTRKLEKDAIFFALKGDNFDANSFAQKAIDGGCAYAIVDEENVCNNKTILLVKNVLESLQDLAKYHRQQLKIPVIGITGSNGKTTNKELIHAVLSRKYNTYATKGNLNNHIGVPLTLLAITNYHEIAIVEMGANHQGEIAMLCELTDPDYGLITNIGKAHLEGFGGEEGVRKGKSELYQHLRKKNGRIFINGDDEVLQKLSNGLSKIVYGEKPAFDVYGKLLSTTEFVEFKWSTNGKELDNEPLIKTNMFGHYNFINLICAVCIGHYFGVDRTEINNALQEYVPEMNRSQVKKTDLNSVILDAYNANPSSMSLAITNFKNQAFKRKMVILGDMFELGEYSYKEHYNILSQLNKSDIERIILVGSQFFELKGKFPEYLFFLNTEHLNVYLLAGGIVDFTVLIKGSRGMKLEKIVDYL